MGWENKRGMSLKHWDAPHSHPKQRKKIDALLFRSPERWKQTRGLNGRAQQFGWFLKISSSLKPKYLRGWLLVPHPPICFYPEDRERNWETAALAVMLRLV